MIVITTQCFPPDRGGIENLMGGLADALHSTGHNVAVFADRAHVDGSFAPAYMLKRFGGLKPLRRWTKARAVLATVRANTVHGVFADSWKSAELLPQLPVPLAVLVHGTELPVQPTAAKRRRITSTFARARSIVVNSAYTADAVRAYLADGSKRIHVVHPPIGPMIEPSAAALQRARDLANERGPMLLTVARLEERKGVDNVIRAMPAMLRAHGDAFYVVAGPGKDRPRLEALARDLGVGERVIFVGPVDGEQKAALFASADLFVMPARRVGNSVESYGIAYVEAGWYGVPSIAGRDGGAADAVIDGKTGLLCDGHSSEDVARKLLQLLDDDALRKHLGDGARTRSRGPAQWAQSLPLYLNALS